MNTLDPIPVILVTHYEFCPRRAWLYINEGSGSDSFAIEKGIYDHRKVDDPHVDGKEITSLTFYDTELNLTGKIDKLLVSGDNSFELVEYKSTPVKREPHVSSSMIIQLALQKLGLEHNGYHLTSTGIYFVNHKLRVTVPIGIEEEARALEALEHTRALIDSPVSPPVLIDDMRCMRCSHIEICLPEEKIEQPITRIIARNPDSRVVHINKQGSTLTVKAGRIVVQTHGEEAESYPIEKTQSLHVYGNVLVSSALIRELHALDVPILWLKINGKVNGYSKSTYSPNGLARSQQGYKLADHGFALAKNMIEAKIHNQCTLLRKKDIPPSELKRLKQLEKDTSQAKNLTHLLGIEGGASKIYFNCWHELIKHPELTWQQREKRGSDDPINMLLNYNNGLLLSECIKALLSAGLDPHIGVLHSSNRNKPALALDLMEEFRAPISEANTLSIINKHTINDKDIAFMRQHKKIPYETRKKILIQHEKKLTSTIQHPTYKYEATWRRIIEIQARSILAIIEETQTSYIGVKTR